MTNRKKTTGRVLGGGALLGVVLALGIAGGGCQRTALREDDPRSQFERYDASRNDLEPPFLEDEFGQRQPNLRGRLLVRD